MRKLLLALLIAAVPAAASPALFSKYDAVRKSLVANDLAAAQKNAAALRAEGQKAKSRTVAELAQAVEKSRDLAGARRAFGLLSEEMIKVRKSAKGARPAVYHCPMIQKAWLQPKGQVGNPYDASMPTCGTLKEE